MTAYSLVAKFAKYRLMESWILNILVSNMWRERLPKRSFLFSNDVTFPGRSRSRKLVVPSFVSVKYFHRNPWVFDMRQKWRFSNNEVKFPSCLSTPLCTKIRGSVYKVRRTLFHDCHNICTSLWHSKSRSKCRSNGRKTLNAWFIHTPCRHIAC